MVNGESSDRIGLRHADATGTTDDRRHDCLRRLVEQTPDTDLLRKMIGFPAQRGSWNWNARPGLPGATNFPPTFLDTGFAQDNAEGPNLAQLDG